MSFMVIVFGLIVLIPLVAILTEHQRKMATLRLKATRSNRIEVLERRVAELTELVHEQTIALDGTVGRTGSESARSAPPLSV